MEGLLKIRIQQCIFEVQEVEKSSTEGYAERGKGLREGDRQGREEKPKALLELLKKEDQGEDRNM